MGAQNVGLQTKIGLRKVKTCCFTQQNGFGSAFLHRMQRLIKGTANPNLLLIG
jgi:hypothetical protein